MTNVINAISFDMFNEAQNAYFEGNDKISDLIKLMSYEADVPLDIAFKPLLQVVENYYNDGEVEKPSQHPRIKALRSMVIACTKNDDGNYLTVELPTKKNGQTFTMREKQAKASDPKTWEDTLEKLIKETADMTSKQRQAIAYDAFISIMAGKRVEATAEGMQQFMGQLDRTSEQNDEVLSDEAMAAIDAMIDYDDDDELLTAAS